MSLKLLSITTYCGESCAAQDEGSVQMQRVFYNVKCLYVMFLQLQMFDMFNNIFIYSYLYPL